MMSSRVPDWIHTKFDHFSIKNQPNSNCWSYSWMHIEFDSFSIMINSHFRLNQMVTSRDPAQIHIECDQFAMKDQSNNEPESPRLNVKAHNVYKPYECNGLDEYERLKTFQTIIYVTFVCLSSITDQTCLQFLGLFCFVGSSLVMF